MEMKLIRDDHKWFTSIDDKLIEVKFKLKSDTWSLDKIVLPSCNHSDLYDNNYTMELTLIIDSDVYELTIEEDDKISMIAKRVKASDNASSRFVFIDELVIPSTHAAFGFFKVAA